MGKWQSQELFLGKLESSWLRGVCLCGRGMWGEKETLLAQCQHGRTCPCTMQCASITKVNMFLIFMGNILGKWGTGGRHSPISHPSTAPRTTGAEFLLHTRPSVTSASHTVSCTLILNSLSYLFMCTSCLCISYALSNCDNQKLANACHEKGFPLDLLEIGESCLPPRSMTRDVRRIVWDRSCVVLQEKHSRVTLILQCQACIHLVRHNKHTQP